jgi:glycerol-3-phosphate O-acyltransferase
MVKLKTKVMKKGYILILLSILFCSLISLSQTKDEKADMKFVNTLFNKIKESRIDSKDTLIWTYIYSDTSMIKLQSLSQSFQSYGLTVDLLIKVSKNNPNKKELTISEERAFTPETLYERWTQLNAIAKAYDLDDYRSKISGETKINIENLVYKPR